MTDKECVEFLTKCANIPYKDYSWLKDHCYRTLERPCSPSARNEHLAILDLIKEHEERQWIPLSDDTIKNGVDVLLKTTDGDIYKTHLSITGTLPDGGEEELKNIEAFMIIE